MDARSVLFLVAAFVISFPLNVAGGSFSKDFERRHDISRLILNVPGGEVRSLLQCGAVCARSSSCKAFCYSQSTALCHLSQPDDPIGQQYNGSDFKCYNQSNLDDKLWMGADDLEVKGQYKWSDSSLLADDTPVWYPAQPNNQAQRCVELAQNDLRLWDAWCYSTKSFVCQIDV